MPAPEELRDAAAQLRNLLAAVERGEVRADSPSDRAVRRRLEGAVLALEAAADLPPDDLTKTS